MMRHSVYYALQSFLFNLMLNVRMPYGGVNTVVSKSTCHTIYQSICLKIWGLIKTTVLRKTS